MRKVKEFMKRIAAKIVVYYYARIYRKAVALANKKHEEKGETFYVIDHFLKGQTLSVINRKEFRWIKHQAQKMGPGTIYWSNGYGMEMLRKRAWYHTPDRSGANGLSEKEKYVRKMAFLRSGLRKARLV